MEQTDPKRLARERMLAGAERFVRDIANPTPLGGRFVGPPPAKRNKPAEDAFKTLQVELEAFEAKLIHVHTIRFDPPDVLLFEGFTPEGDETLAIQHVAQLNLQLVKQPRLQATAFRVGFIHPTE